MSAHDIIYNNRLIVFLINLLSKKSRKLWKMNKIPLHYAAESNSDDIGQYLIDGVDIDSNDINYLNVIEDFKWRKFEINKGNFILGIKLHFIMQQRKIQNKCLI